MPLMDWIANNLSFTPIGRGILAAREQEEMKKYRQQMMQRQQQEWDLGQQQTQAAQAAFKPGAPHPEQIPVTPQVGSPGYDQTRQQLDQTQTGTASLVDYLKGPQSAMAQGLAKAGLFTQAGNLVEQGAPKPREWVEETVGGLPGQRNIGTGKFDPFPQSQAAQAPQTRQVPQGNDLVTFEYQGGQWKEIGRAPRFRPPELQPSKGQQGGAWQLPEGDVVGTRFDPNTGNYEFQDKDTKWKPVPPGARPVTLGTGGALTAQQFNKLEGEYNQSNIGLQRLEKYFNTLGGTDTGITRIANDLSANLKTLFGSGKLNSQEFAQRSARQQLQTLLGAMRLEVLGPGVLTEYDAQRLILAAGGDINALQNPQVAADALRQVYEYKRSNTALQREQLLRSAPAYKGQVSPVYGPEELGGGQQPGPQDDGEPPPPDVDPNDWKYMTPEERALWRK